MAKKKSWTNEERSAMVQRLQDDIEDFVAQKSLEARAKKVEDTRSIDEIIEEMKQHPAFLDKIDLTKPLNPEVEALMQLKYETENPTERAKSYKEDGNEEFKKKKYSIAIVNYTEGITSKSPDRELNAVLYTNRAAAQYHLGNYRSAFNDCIFARKFKPDHFKAILRGGQCSFNMRKWDDTIRWCDSGLMMEEENTILLEMRAKAEREKRIKERDERKKAAQERKEEMEEKKLIELIQSKDVRLAHMKVPKDSKISPSLLTNLESHNPTGAKVHLDPAGSGTLLWPVIFFYPEYAETDFISAFSEHDCFLDHLNLMFGGDTEPPSWDEERKYKPNNLQIVFENLDDNKLYDLPLESTLLEALQHKKYIVYGGTPGFVIMVKNSSFKDKFFKRYK